MRRTNAAQHHTSQGRRRSMMALRRSWKRIPTISCNLHHQRSRRLQDPHLSQWGETEERKRRIHRQVDLLLAHPHQTKSPSSAHRSRLPSSNNHKQVPALAHHHRPNPPTHLGTHQHDRPNPKQRLASNSVMPDLEAREQSPDFLVHENSRLCRVH